MSVVKRIRSPPEEVTSVCRSIKTLRPPYADEVTEDDVQAAALQYVRKISGFRRPAAHNAEAFDAAVAAVTDATRELLARLEVRSTGSAVRAGDDGRP
jgi:hypothetical protein